MCVRAPCGSRAPCGLRARCGSRAQQSRPTLARCLPGVLCSAWLWARSDSVCQLRVYSCVPGHCTRSVGNAPLLNGCSVPDRVHGPVTGAAPPLGRCFWWWCGCLSGSWAPSCLAARETSQPRFARSVRPDSRPNPSGGASARAVRVVVGPRCSPQYLGRINLLGLRIGGLALPFVGPSCAGGVFGAHLGAGVSRGGGVQSEVCLVREVDRLVGYMVH